MGKAKRLPDELAEIAFMRALGVPLAVDYMSIGDVPARLVIAKAIFEAARADAQEWQRQDTESKAKTWRSRRAR